MKKIFIILVVFALNFVSAQNIKTEAGTFIKPEAGTFIVEATLTPNVVGGGIFSLSSISSDLGLLGVKARKFESDKKAYRIGANLAILDTGEEGVDSEFSCGLSLGIEHHMRGAERLSTYWGYEAYIGYVTTNNEYDDEDFYYDAGQTTKFGLGANVFTGFDYYIIPKLYLGAEVAYGLAVTNTMPDEGDSTTRVQLAPSITPSFRMGWQF